MSSSNRKSLTSSKFIILNTYWGRSITSLLMIHQEQKLAKDRSGWVSPVINSLHLSYNKDSGRPSISNYMLDWGTLISVALNKIEWASTHSLPALLHGPCVPLHCYCRKEGTFVTVTLTVQKTFSYMKAKKFHVLALFMGWSTRTTKTTQRNDFHLENQHNQSNSTLSYNPPSTSYRWLAEQVLLFVILYTETCLWMKILRIKGDLNQSKWETHAKKPAFLDNIK